MLQKHPPPSPALLSTKKPMPWGQPEQVVGTGRERRREGEREALERDKTLSRRTFQQTHRQAEQPDRSIRVCGWLPLCGTGPSECLRQNRGRGVGGKRLGRPPFARAAQGCSVSCLLAPSPTVSRIQIEATHSESVRHKEPLGLQK